MQKGKIKLITRNGLDWTNYFSTIVKDLKKIQVENAILDGEIVAFDKKGHMSFQALQESIKRKTSNLLKYFIFDLPFLKGHNLQSFPLLERKRLLKLLLQDLNSSRIIFSEFIQGSGEQILQEACKNKMEGIISKKIDAPYLNQRTKTWLKSKCSSRQEFVIGGFTKPKGSRKNFGALLIGYFQNNKFMYSGKVGTGFSSSILQELYQLFSKKISKHCPFFNEDIIPDKRNATWLKPKLVCEIEYTEITKDGLLRHPAFIALRQDKKAAEVIREDKAKIEMLTNQAELATKKDDERNQFQGTTISHPDRIVFPECLITKREVVSYYDKISPFLLPYIINRPLSILRCPEGISKECFFQKHPSQGAPKSIFPFKHPSDPKTYFYIKNAKGLIALAQLGALEFHVGGAKIDNLEKPDIITFDLDPDPDLSWKLLLEGVSIIKEILSAMQLECFIKTTGGKGFHILIPIIRKHTWEVIKPFTRLFAEQLSLQFPEKFVSTANKNKRKNKIYIDYLRNSSKATSVVTYSLRANAKATISMPISWEELQNIPSSGHFTLQNSNIIFEKKYKDPWADFFKARQYLPI